MSAFRTQRRWMGLALFALAAWTLVIKFALPVAWALRDGTPLHTAIWWDFWWVAHLLVGYRLIWKPRATWKWAMALAVVETVIIATKFALFLPSPSWDVMHLNWFINKSVMLAYFIYSLGWLTPPAVRKELS